MVTSSNSPPNIPVSIQGYVTDPKLVGYQLLTNYESTYWRALVGNDAWSLYEVLRSFCHEGRNTCNPSIRYLAAILGLKKKKRASKFPKYSVSGHETSSEVEGGNLPPEQHPINNTHKTTLETKRNNNSSGKQDPKQNVVVVLAQRGISENVSQRLTDRY